jgi:AcrR family transcriptional regulator
MVETRRRGGSPAAGDDRRRGDDGSGARERLLDAAIAYAGDHGISDVSLRELARALGTSHRMLLYHFGSRRGLVVAIVQRLEARQRDVLAQLGAEPGDEPAGTGRAMWRHLADPAMAPYERLFYEVYAHALQGRPGTDGFLDDVVDSWLEPATAYWAAQGRDPAAARAEARLGLAVVRGLLLDLLATGDRAGVDEALERYLLHVGGGAGQPAGGGRRTTAAPGKEDAR